MLATILIDYFAAIQIDNFLSQRRKKATLIFSIISTCAVLFIFKYFNFFIGNFNMLFQSMNWNYPIPLLEWILPVGLSFHTFQSLSYVIEVYRGNQKAEKHLGIYALYVMFYPQLVAGPIERPQNLLPQFRIKHKFDQSRIILGLRRILWGMFKKVVIADRLGYYVNQVFDNPADYHGVTIYIATFFFAYQIYCDFSGYTDIAIGTAKVMGFDLMENFKLPYYSRSIKEFWSRWHISLSTWFKDYVYIPLGGNRKSVPRWIMNLFVTFLISGVWHGAHWTFVAWGSLHGIYLIIENLIRPLEIKNHNKLIQFIQWFITLNLVIFAWLFFRANDLNSALLLIKSGFNFSFSESCYELKNFSWNNLYSEYWIAIMSIVFLEIIQFVSRKTTIEKYLENWPKFFRWSFYLILTEMIIWLGYYGMEAKFIYFQF